MSSGTCGSCRLGLLHAFLVRRVSPQAVVFACPRVTPLAKPSSFANQLTVKLNDRPGAFFLGLCLCQRLRHLVLQRMEQQERVLYAVGSTT